MTTKLSRSISIIMAMGIIALLGTFGAGSASAQFRCEPLMVINNLPCPVTIYLVSPENIAVPFNIGPHQQMPIPFHLYIQSVEFRDVCGVLYGFTESGCVNYFQLPGCCANICLDVSNCLLTFMPVPGPCRCLPPLE